jgi:hypothetical protein
LSSGKANPALAPLSGPGALRDPASYPRAFLQPGPDGVRVALRYRREWQDGYGARGWKLEAAVGDPAIIASTRETGDRIPTSVLVHDVLDHFLSGFAVSGHRAEAMATVQLSERTASPVERDFLQLVDEDLLFGQVNGESLASFLPADLLSRVPAAAAGGTRAMMHSLQQQLGRQALRERLVQRLFDLGKRGKPHARRCWRALGLEYGLRGRIGEALQRILQEADLDVERAGTAGLCARFLVGNRTCALETDADAGAAVVRPSYTAVVA